MSAAERLSERVNRLWARNGALDLFDRLYGKLSNNLPQFAHAIVVTVQAGPQGDIRRAYYLALAAAFGRYRNGVKGSVGSSSLSATWDITGKAVQVEIGYTANAVWEAGRAAAGIQEDSALRVLAEGPTQVTVGGEWPGFLLQTRNRLGVGNSNSGVLGGLPNIIQELARRSPQSQTPYSVVNPGVVGQLSSTIPGCFPPGDTEPVVFATDGTKIDVFKELIEGTGSNRLIPWGAVRPLANGDAQFGSRISPITAMPALPDANRVITTGEKNDPRVQNPRPALDGSTRSGLLALVSAELARPCFLPSAPPCTSVPVLSSGLFVRPIPDDVPMNAGAIRVVDTPATDVDEFGGGFFGSILRALRGPDGYLRVNRAANVAK